MPSEKLLLALCTVALAQAALGISSQLFHRQNSRHHKLLTSILLTLTLLISPPVFQEFFPALEIVSYVLMLPALLTIAPLLWLYTQALTATPDDEQAIHWSHFTLSVLGACCALSFLLLPQQIQRQVLTTGELGDGQFIPGLMLCVFILILCWVLQSGYYLWRITQSLRSYRQQLKQWFANCEQRQLYWLDMLAVLIVSLWLIVAVSVLAENLFNTSLAGPHLLSAVIVVMVWCLVLLGSKQQPGFSGIDQQELQHNPLPTSSEQKYQRSALAQEQAQRIADKMQQVMQQQRLYLDANISLPKLAEAVGTSCHYLSQTLNQTLQQSFFDYVNNWRIQAACELLLSSDKTVLDIAFEVGFNSKSAFYKAFKLQQNCTPAAYRKSQNNPSQ